MRRRRWAAAVVALATLPACAASSHAPATTPVRRPVGPGAGAVWRPGPGLHWQWQLRGRSDLGVTADVYDLDWQDTSPDLVARLHAAGRRVICYVDIGAVESYRPDAGSFAASVQGRRVDGYPEERYLDVRQVATLAPPLLRRFDTCRAKAFDGVEGDVVDAFSNDSGFPITAADEVSFLRWFAAAVRARGLAAGLKNDAELVPTVAPSFDFAIVEECVRLGTCGSYSPLVRAGKAVFDAEYQGDPLAFCPLTDRLGISAIRKHTELDAWRETC